jgi:quinoprotein glucose dehydrogenase
MKNERTGIAGRLALWAYSTLLLVLGLGLAIGGFTLVTLGGSPYYLLAGLTMLASGVLIWRRRVEGAWLYGLLLLLSVVWALWEVGLDGWALAPRLIALALVGLGLITPWIRRNFASSQNSPMQARLGRLAGMAAATTAVTAAVGLGMLLHWLGPVRPADPIYRTGFAESRPSDSGALESDTAQAGDWLHYGNDAGGSRFSKLAQITPDNVDEMKVAWTYRTGDVATPLEVTPLKVDDSIYLCTGTNDVIALDAETGAERWRFNSGAVNSAAPLKVCRGVAYYRVPGAVGDCGCKHTDRFH